MSKLVFSEWRALQPIVNGAKARFHVISRMFSSANALYESLLGAPAPSKGSRSIEPHDHTDYIGGLPVHRGLIGGFDHGESNSFTGFSRTIHASEVSTRVPFLIDTAPSSEYIRPAYDLAVYVTRGITKNKTNRASNPCVLEAKLLVFNSGVSGGGVNADVFFKNTDTGDETSIQLSLVGGSTPSLEEFHITDLPINTTGGWNTYRVDVNSNGATTIDIVQCVIVETLERSQPVSNGNQEFHNATTRP